MGSTENKTGENLYMYVVHTKAALKMGNNHTLYDLVKSIIKKDIL